MTRLKIVIEITASEKQMSPEKEKEQIEAVLVDTLEKLQADTHSAVHSDNIIENS